MRLFMVLMVVVLQFQSLLLASRCFTLDMQNEHNEIKETEALAEDGELHIAAISKRGGGGGGRGGGGGGRGGGRGSRSGMLPFYGAAGAAAAAAGTSHHKHHRGSACQTAQFGLTLPSVLLSLGIYLIHF